jgi:phosphotransferase system enzyme I (PtsP)
VNAVTSGPRLLLKKLREVMAGQSSAQKRLDQVVRLIASNMVAEVCSVYLVRAGEILELFATEGLHPEAVHQTRLRFGEGLTGVIAASAQPLSLSDAKAHPKFAYRSETGEEIYMSFLGVPILRAGKVIGVLTVQNKTRRQYSEEEAEALQTIAMVLAELVGSGELINPEELNEATLERAATPCFEGVTFADGISVGIAVLHEAAVQITHHVSEDTETERQRLKDGLKGLHDQIDQLLSAEDMGGGEHRDILDVYRMFAEDTGWQNKIQEAIETGLTAEAAVERVQIENRSRMASIQDPYIRERLSDLDDLSNRLIRHLVGRPETAAGERLPENAILIARSLGPAELLEYDRSRLKGVVLQDGSQTAHVTIVARALGIPLVGQLGGVLSRIGAGETIIVDGERGMVHVSPAPEVLQSYQENIQARSQRLATYAALRDAPAITKDGVEIELLINAGLAIDLPNLDKTGAAGIGLFRTEFQFMVSSALPKLETQTEFYTSVLDAAGARPVVFRTLDIGGDKKVAFMEQEAEENPAMGWRAVRVALDRPALLRYQLRALLQAAAGRELRVMFPMVADVSEFRAAHEIGKREIERFARTGRTLPSKILFGSMLEVPSIVWQLEKLLPFVDFLSIGSNDLMQFFFAADRGNPKLSGRYDVLSPGALTLIKSIVDTCARGDVPLTLCGEMGAKPLEAMALCGLGLRRISISPSSIGPVKTMIRSLNVSAFRPYLLSLLDGNSPTLRGKLLTFAQDHEIAL